MKKPSNDAIGCLVSIFALSIIVLLCVITRGTIRSIIIYLSCVIGIPGWLLYCKHLNDKTIKSLPQKEELVKVFSKTSNSTKKSATYYYISFLFPDKSRKNLEVSLDIYNTILEGETGILTYKNQLDKFVKIKGELIFLGFKPL